MTPSTKQHAHKLTWGDLTTSDRSNPSKGNSTGEEILADPANRLRWTMSTGGTWRPRWARGLTTTTTTTAIGCSTRKHRKKQRRQQQYRLVARMGTNGPPTHRSHRTAGSLARSLPQRLPCLHYVTAAPSLPSKGPASWWRAGASCTSSSTTRCLRTTKQAGNKRVGGHVSLGHRLLRDEGWALVCQQRSMRNGRI